MGSPIPKETDRSGRQMTLHTTVIIPNYNGKEYLNNCLLSLEQCIPFDFEILVVDNGSTDGSVSLLKKKFPHIRSVFLKDNTGFAGAVNVGLAGTVTEYAILLNNDTTVEPDFVAKMESAIEKKRNTFSVSARMMSMQEPSLLDGAGDLYCALGWAFALGKGKPAGQYYRRFTEIFSACGGAVIYRMKYLKQIGFFDENHFAYLEDTDIGYRALIYGYRNYYEPEAVCYHAGSGSTGSRYNEFKIKLSSRNSIYLIYKNMPVFQVVLNLPFLLIGYLIKLLFFMKKGYGGTYCRGLAEGFRLSISEEGRKHKISFWGKHLPQYLKIQILLWLNMFRRITG